VGDTGLPLEDPGALQLDVLGTEVVEEAAPLAEEHGDEVDRGHCAISRSGARRLRTKIGRPSWWSPPQPPPGSKVPRPATMNPSRDIDM
jgi:hypothetical protein